MKIGNKYKIRTKKGTVEKYLSYIDNRTGSHYFVDKKEKVNPSLMGGFYKTRGTVHNIENVIPEKEIDLTPFENMPTTTIDNEDGTYTHTGREE